MNEASPQDALTLPTEGALTPRIGERAELGPIDDSFWEELLLFIEDGKVIPVVGERAVTVYRRQLQGQIRAAGRGGRTSDLVR